VDEAFAASTCWNAASIWPKAAPTRWRWVHAQDAGEEIADLQSSDKVDADLAALKASMNKGA
jgi:hypothetical protein